MVKSWEDGTDKRDRTSLGGIFYHHYQIYLSTQKPIKQQREGIEKQAR